MNGEKGAAKAAPFFVAWCGHDISDEGGMILRLCQKLQRVFHN